MSDRNRQNKKDLNKIQEYFGLLLKSEQVVHAVLPDGDKVGSSLSRCSLLPDLTSEFRMVASRIEVLG